MSQRKLTATPLADKLAQVAGPAVTPLFGQPASRIAPRPLFATPVPGAAAEAATALSAAAVAAETEARERELESARIDAEKAGLASAQAKVEEIVERYLDGIQRLLTATRLAHRPEPGEVVELSLLVAREILGRELSIDRSHVLATLDRALGSVSADTQLVLRVSPADAAYVKQRRPELLREGVVLVEDKKLAVGGCIVETPAWVLDASIEARLEAVRTGLVELLSNPALDVDDVDESQAIEPIDDASGDGEVTP